MDAGASRKRSTAIISGGTLLLHAGFFCGLAVWLWSRDHYQFFPLVLCGSAALAWYRLQDAKWNHTPCLTLRVAGLGTAACMLFAAAALIQSNWLGSLAGILSLWALIWFYGGFDIADRLRGPVFLLLLTIPIPLNFDLKLVIWLQKVATAAASSLLDMLQVWHNTSGVAITTVQRSFMVEEACSGIHSLFSCLCAVIFVCVLRRSGFLRIVINAIQTAGWVIAANAIRVFLVIYAFSKWDLPLDKGWPHEALGVATYALALVLSLSTDRLFLFFVPTSHIPFVDAGATYSASGNVVSQLLTFIGTSRKRLNRFLNQGRLAERLSISIVASVLVLLFAPFAFVDYSRLLASSKAVAGESGIAGAPNLDGNLSEVVPDNAVPHKVEQWQLVNTDRVNRTPDDPQGTNSTVFTFAGEGLTVRFSVDGYYSEWHDLAYCYTALDWKLKSQQNYKDASAGNHATQLSLYTDDGQYSVSYFSCFDSQLQSVKPGAATIGVIPTFSVLMERLPWSSPSRPEKATIVPPIFQLQLMCSSSHELLDYERENLQRLFSVLSQHALQSFTKASP